MPIRHHIGESVWTKAAIDPEDASASATVTGEAIDRTAIANGGVFLSGKLHLACGAATGSPSAQTVDALVTHSATSGGSYVTLLDKDGNDVEVTQLTADDTESSQSFDLTGANAFLKVVVTVALTGGSTPTIPIAATLALGGGEIRPVA